MSVPVLSIDVSAADISFDDLREERGVKNRNLYGLFDRRFQLFAKMLLPCLSLIYSYIHYPSPIWAQIKGARIVIFESFSPKIHEKLYENSQARLC